MRIAVGVDATGSDSAAERHATALATRSAVPLVRIHVTPDDDAVDEVVARVREIKPAILVLGTHARHGLDAMLHASVAEAIARNVEMPTLVVPNRARGFVADDGTLVLPRVIVPARDPVDAQRAIPAVRLVLELLAAPNTPIDVSTRPLDDLLADARRDGALVAMTTRGHDGLRDVLRGSHTEHAIRGSGCAVLCVPA